MHTSLRFALALAVLLGVPTMSAAQVQAGDLSLVLGQLDAAVRSLPPAGVHPRLRAAVDWLTTRAKTPDPATISPEYVRSLQRAAELIRTGGTPAILADVADELDAKVEHCRKLGIGMGGSVQVTISTRQSGVAVGSWQVFYLLKIYEHVKDSSANTFPALSTPTDARLDPGRYWFWARDPATGRISRRTLIPIVGSSEVRVDLPVQ